MYADVIVLTYQAPGVGYFTYKVPNGLKIRPGQLVKVPFGKREPIGLVISTSPKISNFKLVSFSKEKQISNLKTVSELILPNPLLPPYLLDLLRWMADYYRATLVNCLEAMIPEVPRKSLMVHGSSGISKNPINDKQPTINQTLVLVPTINRLAQTLAKYPQAKSPVIYHNQLKTSQKFDAWLKILNGQTDYIFGSRSAIFTPCPNLKKIIIYDEHDGAYKDERSPYFDTLTIAEKLLELTQAKLEIYDSAPKITTFYRVQPCIREESPSSILKTQKTFIVDLTEERKAGNYSPISTLLADFIKRNSNKGGQTLLFLNKKAESGQFFCKNCQNQTFLKDTPLQCPNCKSKNFFFRSTNLFTLASDVKKIANVIPKLIAVDKTFRPFYSPSPVDIATSYIFYTQTFRRYQLVAQVFADSILNSANFNAAEELFAQIAHLKNLLTEKGVLVIQTYNPQNPILKFAASQNYGDFYESQIEERKKLLFPPFALLVKLTLRGKNPDKLAKSAQQAYLNLKGNTQNTQVLGPYQTYQAKTQARYNIILKQKVASYDLKAREKAIEEMKPLLQLAEGWQITVEPSSLN